MQNEPPRNPPPEANPERTPDADMAQDVSPWVVEPAAAPVSRGTQARSKTFWVAMGGLALAALLFFLVILFLIDEGISANRAANAPTPSPAPLPVYSQPGPTQTPAPPGSLLSFATSTPVVTITMSRPRTSTPRVRPSATPTPVKYKVRTGDTLASVAKKFGVTTSDLIRVNALKDTSLTVGQTLLIPTKPK